MYKKLLFFFVLFTTVAVNAQWVQTNGPYGGNVTCLAFKGTDLFAGISVGVYLSTNNGASWTAANTGLPGHTVLSLAMGATGDLFCGTNGGGIYISTNNGTSWTADTAGLTNNGISSIAVNGTNLFAGTNGGGIFLSTNNGTNWTPVNNGLSNSNSMYVSSLVVSPTGTGDTNLFAGTEAGIYLSTNNGTSWTSVLSGNGDTYQLVVSSNGTGGTNLFAGFSLDGGTLGGGITLSTNNGTSWTSIDLGYTGTGGCLSLAAIPNDTGVVSIYAGMYPDSANYNPGGGVFVSTNNGKSWTAVNSGLPDDEEVRSLAVSGTNLFAGTSGSGVWMRPISEMITGVTGNHDNLPANYSLQQNYPNPFNPSTTIKYSVPKTSLVTIKVYNVLGKEIATLVNEEKSAGNYSVQFTGSKLSSGVYFYRMQADSFVQTKKLLLLK